MGKDHTAFGRARHPFMTGSGGWAYFAATRWLLGVRPDFDGLWIDPCIPSAWKGFSVVRRWRGTEYRITVPNPDGRQKGVRPAAGGRPGSWRGAKFRCIPRKARCGLRRICNGKEWA